MKYLTGRASQRGVTLLELVIALIVIGVLATISAPSVNAWIQAASKKTCVANQSLVQTHMRAYSGLNNIAVGGALNYTSFLGTSNTSLMPVPKCKAGSTAYTFATTVPATGTRYATCGNLASVHVPDDFSTW